MSDERIGCIKDALRAVIDPELGHNIVDLGFVYDISLTGDAVRIIMTATTPSCPATAFLKSAVAERAAGVEGIVSVDVEMIFQPPWTPSRIAPAIRASFGFAAIN